LVAQAEEGPFRGLHRHQAPGVAEAGAFHEETAEAALAGELVRFRPGQLAGEMGVRGWLRERAFDATNVTQANGCQLK
jgi:hypothetical protein